MTRKFALGSTGPLSGKTTLAKHLEKEYGFLYVSHSRTLVESFVDLWNIGLPHNSGDPNTSQVTVEQVYADKESWRLQLQQYGYQMGYNTPGRAKELILRTLQPWLNNNSKQDVVFDPWRGEVQARALRELGFERIQIEISEVERKRRAGDRYGEVWAAIYNEPGLELGILNPDITLNGELPTDVQARILMHRQERPDGLTIFGSEI